MKTTAWALIGLLLVAIVPLAAQSVNLMELKKKEEERRKKAEKSKIVLTDTNVGKVAGSEKKYGYVEVEGTAAATTEEAAQTEGTAAEPQQPIDETRTPEYWQNLKQEMEKRIKELQEGIARQQTDLNKLWTDYYIKNTQTQQAVIKGSISQLSNQLESDKQSLRQVQTDLQNLFARARKAGIPPGWLR